MQMKIFDGHSDLFTALATAYRAGERVSFSDSYAKEFQYGGVNGNIFVAWADKDLAIPLVKQIEDIFTVADLLAANENTLWRVEKLSELEKAVAEEKPYYLLGVEGLDGLEGKPELLTWLAEKGVRHVGLSWNDDNAFAGGALSKTGQGLTTLGKSLVRSIEKSSTFLLDVSHLNVASFWEVLELAQGPLIASHSNSATLCAVPRNLNDEQLRALASTGGVVGVNSYPLFVDNLPERRNVQRLADHVEYMVDLIGIDHVGCGFDYNYWDLEAEKVVLNGLEDVAQSQNLLQELQKRGYKQEALAKIAGQNFLRVIRQRLPQE